MVCELREFLSEHIQTCFFTNFYFEHNGERLNEYQELINLDLVTNSKIFLRPERYDEKSARAHVRRLIEVLETAPVLTNSSPTKEQCSPKKSRSRAASASNEDLKENSVAKPEDSDAKQPGNAQDEKLKKSYEELMAVIQAHEHDPNRTLERGADGVGGARVNQASTILEELFHNPISLGPLNRLKRIKCLENIRFDRSHCPVAEDRKLQGDLLYLTVQTLDSGVAEFGVTCTVNGFYHNRSSGHGMGGTFNPAPNSSNPCFSYTLIGCLHQMSVSFGRNLEEYLNSILRTDPYFLTAMPRKDHNWLSDSKALTMPKVSNDEGLG